MKPGTLRVHVDEGGGAGAQHRFGIAAVFLALAAALALPALVRAAVQAFSGLPIELAVFVLGFCLALGSLAVGWSLGRRAEPLAAGSPRDAMIAVSPRWRWEESLAREVNRAARARMPLSLVIVQLDQLDRLNEIGGRAAGDTGIQIVRNILEITCRCRDIAARLGGDEFALLLPRTHAAEARVLAERIRSLVSERRRAQGTPFDRHLTISIGICDLGSLDDPRPHALLHAAERALRVAKQAGHDRIEIGNGKRPPPGSSTVIVLDPRRRARKRSPRRTTV